MTVFRIVTEALTNPARQSGSASARVQLTIRDGALVVATTDSGVNEGPWPLVWGWPR